MGRWAQLLLPIVISWICLTSGWKAFAAFNIPLLEVEGDPVCGAEALPEESRWMKPLLDAAQSKDTPETTALDRYYSRVLKVVVNGYQPKEPVVVLQRPCGGLLIEEADFNRWRIITVDDPAVRIGGVWYIAAGDLEGVETSLDTQREMLVIEAIPERFARTVVDFVPYRPVTPEAALPGAFVNFGLSGSHSAQSSRYTGSLTASSGIFGDPGVLLNDLGLSLFQGGSRFIRLRSVFQRDYVQDMTQVQLGDVFGRGGVVGLGSPVGGVRYARHFGTQPAFPFRPLPMQSALLNRGSVVRLATAGWGDELESVVGGQVVQLPTGPVDFVNLPYTNNRDLFVLVTQPDGQQQVVTDRLFLRDGLLRKGVTDFELIGGVFRQGFIDDRYADAVGHAFIRHGLNDGLALGAQGIVAEGYALGGVQVDVAVPYLGVVGIDVASSQGEELSDRPDAGQLLRLDWFNRFDSWGVALRSEWQDEGFRSSPLSLGGSIRRSLLARGYGRVSAPWGQQSIVASWSHQKRYTNDDRETVRLAFPLRIWRRSFVSLAFQQELQPEREFGATLQLSIPLESRADRQRLERRHRARSVRRSSRLTFGARWAEGRDWSGTINGSTGGSQNADSWRLSASSPLDDVFANPAINLYWTAQRWSAFAGVRDPFADPSITLGATTGFAWVDGVLAHSRGLYGGFALVDMGAAGAGVRVNGVKADSNGRALLTNLRPYAPVNLLPNYRDLPWRTRRANLSEALFVPRDRIGVGVRFPLRTREDVMLIVAGLNDKELPLGASVSGPDIDTRVGHDGLVYIASVRPGWHTLVIKHGSSRCEAQVLVPESVSSDDVPDLGKVICR